MLPLPTTARELASLALLQPLAGARLNDVSSRASSVLLAKHNYTGFVAPDLNADARPSAVTQKRPMVVT